MIALIMLLKSNIESSKVVLHTVKSGYNNHGYNKLMAVTNKIY